MKTFTLCYMAYNLCVLFSCTTAAGDDLGGNSSGTQKMSMITSDDTAFAHKIGLIFTETLVAM